MTAAGEVVDAEEGQPLWQAARLHLGAFGVVTQLEMQLSERYRLKEKSWEASLDEVVAGIESGDANKGLVRHHLAQAYEASGDKEKARETAELALADHAAYAEARQAAGGRVQDPTWLADARDLVERL